MALCVLGSKTAHRVEMRPMQLATYSHINADYGVRMSLIPTIPLVVHTEKRRIIFAYVGGRSARAMVPPIDNNKIVDQRSHQP